MSEWTYLGHCYGQERFEVGSLNVWEHKWISVMGRPTPQGVPLGISMPPPPEEHVRVLVRDPQHGQEHTMFVYEIVDGPRRVEFAAGEFSNQVWGFYTRKRE